MGQDGTGWRQDAVRTNRLEDWNSYVDFEESPFNKHGSLRDVTKPSPATKSESLTYRKYFLRVLARLIYLDFFVDI